MANANDVWTCCPGRGFQTTAICGYAIRGSYEESCGFGTLVTTPVPELRATSNLLRSRPEVFS